MTTSQEAATASKPKTPSPISLFGPPPLIEGENAADYDELHARVFDAVRPTDFIVKIWIRDIVDGTWTIIRLRRIQAAFLTERVLDEADREAWFALAPHYQKKEQKRRNGRILHHSRQNQTLKRHSRK
jgi:hypothetical protein